MLTREELQVVADLAIEHDVIVVTDEVYEHLVFDDARSAEGHVPIATLPGMRERTLTLSSAGKSYSFTGWSGDPEVKVSHCLAASTACTSGAGPVAHPTFQPVNE